MSLDFLKILGRWKKNKISQGGVWADLTPPFVTSVSPAGNRCHLVLLDKDESCPTADLSNIRVSQWSGLFNRWAVEHAPGLVEYCDVCVLSHRNLSPSNQSVVTSRVYYCHYGRTIPRPAAAAATSSSASTTSASLSCCYGRWRAVNNSWHHFRIFCLRWRGRCKLNGLCSSSFVSQYTVPNFACPIGQFP